MKANVVISVLILTLTILQACSENEENALVVEQTYTGIFYRIHPQARYEAADVTLNLVNDQFAGTSSKQNYPAICNGQFEEDNGKIRFENACAFTADFDWSYIVDGTYDIDIQEEYIYFIQEIDTEVYNVFRFPR